MANTSRTKPGEAIEVVTEDNGVETLKNVQKSFEKNQKAIIGAIVAVVVLVGGYFGYKQFVVQPNEEKAANALFSAERWFEVDSLNLVLNGTPQQPGALNVIKKYGSTEAGNLARYYAGMSYLRMGDAKNAITHLEKFDGKGTPLENLTNGALGDAYMESGNAAKGIEFYKKAATNESDMFTSPRYLFRAALASETTGKTEEAKKLYKEILEKYPNTQEGNNAMKYLARLGEVNID